MKTRSLLAALLCAAAVTAAHADAVTDWNLEAGKFIADAKPGTPVA